MTTLISFVVLGFGLIGFFRTLGFIGGIGLIILWWTRVKSTVALFHDKNKIRATLMFFVPGLILVLLGAYYRFIWTPSYDDYSFASEYPEVEYVPTLAELFIANYSDKVGKIQVGDFVDSLQPKEARQIDIQSKKDSDTLRAWLGDSLVIDTILTGGSWVGNFSDDITVVAEEVVYSAYSSASTEDLGYMLLSEAGLERFSTSTSESVYGFSSTAPSSISVSSSTGAVHKWDVSTLTNEELLAKLIEALGKSDDVEEDEDSEEE
jgi:hypothetical protein